MEKKDDDEEFDKLDHILEQSGCLKELEESKDCQNDSVLSKSDILQMVGFDGRYNWSSLWLL